MTTACCKLLHLLKNQMMTTKLGYDWQSRSDGQAHIAGRRCSLNKTEESNFIRIVVLGLGAPLTATKCAVTLKHHKHNTYLVWEALHRKESPDVADWHITHLAGNPAPSKAPLTMPAMKAAQLSCPMSLGTEMYFVTKRSKSLIMYSSSACMRFLQSAQSERCHTHAFNLILIT